VVRELKEECSIDGHFPELFMVAGDPERDPRKHIISIVYTITAGPNDQPIAADDAATAQWFNLQDVVKNESGKFDMAFDHRKIFEKFLRKNY
jgi:8-oxo-dGTP diphosphatase